MDQDESTGGVSGEEYLEIVRSSVLDGATFLRATLGHNLRDDGSPWVKVNLRPVLVGGQRAIQFMYSTGTKTMTQNFCGNELTARLDETLATPFSRIHIQTTAGDIHIRVSRKGRVLITKARASRSEPSPDLSHDRRKRYLLDLGRRDPFLEATGIMTWDGIVRPTMQDKFRQINEFLRVIEQVFAPLAARQAPLHIVDCGCGAAHLTLAAYHFLHNIHGLPVHISGVDTNQEIIARGIALRDSLGWNEPEFVVSRILDYEPPVPPDMVLSLHACDGATDEAIARGILWKSRTVLSAPCCHHELHHRLAAPLFAPLIRHGVLRERLADLLTDTFRALALRIMGYRTHVIEFVSPEYTSKNLMIRATRGLRAGDARFVREYQELKRFWNVTPVIEELLGEQLRKFLREEA